MGHEALPDVDRLIERAVDASGLDDFGPDGWEDGLAALVDSARSEGALSDLGAAVFRTWIRDRLLSRLRIVDWAERHPEEVDGPVEAPLVVTGLGRSGTTFLLELLASDRANRALMKWEAQEAVPPPESATFHTDPRIQRCVDATEAVYAGAPELKAVHWEPGDGPTECLALLGQAFRGTDFAGLFTVPGYLRWYLADDQRPAYAFHRLAIGLLQSRAPGRWVLKDPWHLMALDALLATYPDARVVVLHRDPATVVPSLAGLSAASRPDLMRTAPIPPSYWGSQWLEALGVAADRHRAARGRLDASAFLDVAYEDFLADPLATVARIYDFAGRAFTGDVERAVREQVTNRPQHRFGVHRYSLEQFGLSTEQIVERFGPGAPWALTSG